MYSIEWQKRGLPHAHILIWLIRKVTTDLIDRFISAEIPDQISDPQLFDVVTKNMIHGPYGELNLNSPCRPCMIDGKCSKRFPRALTSETITGNDGYPEDNGYTATIKMKNTDVVVDNRWIVPYCPFLAI